MFKGSLPTGRVDDVWQSLLGVSVHKTAVPHYPIPDYLVSVMIKKPGLKGIDVESDDHIRMLPHLGLLEHACAGNCD
jgi:hypothetical protein